MCVCVCENVRAFCNSAFVCTVAHKLLGDSQLGFLRVTLLRAAQQLAAPSGSPPNVFVRLELGRTLHRSQTKWHNVNPIWGSEAFDFTVTDVAECLDITVLHETGEYLADSAGLFRCLSWFLLS